MRAESSPESEGLTQVSSPACPYYQKEHRELWGVGALRCVVRTTDLGLRAWWGPNLRVRQAQGLKQPLGVPTEV